MIYDFTRTDIDLSLPRGGIYSEKVIHFSAVKGKSEEEIFQERAKAIVEAERLLGEPVKVLKTYFGKDYRPLEFLGLV